MDQKRADHDDIPAATGKSKNWKNYTERTRADGGISRFIHPTIGGKQTWIRIPDQAKYKGKKGYERFLAETLAEAQEKATNIRFDDAADQWLTSYDRSKPGTYETYERHIQLHLKPYFGAARLQDIPGTELSKFVELKLADGLTIEYVKIMVWIFRAIYQPYVAAGQIRRDPSKTKIRYRSTELTGAALDENEDDKRSGRALTVDEIRLLINHINPAYQLMVATMVWTGLRIGEAFAMQWRYLDIPNQQYHVERNVNRHRELATPKTAASRATVNLSQYVVEWMERHRAEQAAERLRTPNWIDHDLIFPSCGKFSPTPGMPRAYAPAKQALARGAARAKIGPVHWHDLRHTCATLLIQKQRRNIKEVSKHLRHANPTITQNTYGHLYPEDLPEMAGAMDELILGVK
jgi:integrase